MQIAIFHIQAER